MPNVAISSPVPESPTSALPAPAPAPPCSRCGTFVPDDQTVQFLGKRYCTACHERMMASLRLWPWGYIVGVGMLLNVAVATVLLALNWRRLGEHQRERSMWAATVAIVVMLIAIMAVPTPRGTVTGASVFATWQLSKSYRPVWAELKAKGARRANVVLPVVFATAAVLVVAITLTLVTED